jgi:amino acid adenylation domain-containing protein/FkbM family methyltransferase
MQMMQQESEANTISGFRLSPQQKRLWSFQKGMERQFITHSVIEIDGSLDVTVLHQALCQVVKRYEILRTVFRQLPEMDIPVQVIAEPYDLEIARYDISQLANAEQTRRVSELLEEASHPLVDLQKGPILQASLINLSPHKSILSLALPALCADKGGVRILMREIGQAYSRIVRGEAVNDEPLQYADVSQLFNELLESEETQSGRDYWRKQNFEDSMTLSLAYENSSPVEQGFEVGSLELELNSEQVAAIKALAQTYQTSLRAFFLTCWQTLLTRLTARTNVTVGVLTEGRANEELADCVGLIARELPCSVALDAQLTFGEALQRTTDLLNEMSAAEEYFTWQPGDSPSGNPAPDFCSFAYEWESFAMPYSAADMTLSMNQQRGLIEPFKIKFTGVENRDTFSLRLEYEEARWAKQNISRLAEEWHTLLKSVLENPSTPIGKLRIVGDEERQTLLVRFNDTAADYRTDSCINEWFEQHASATPNRIAVVFEDQHLSFGELNARANQLAHYLREHGVVQESKVGIYLERSPEVIVSLLGILKAGGAYVPLDQYLPKERLTYILEDTKPVVLLTQQTLLSNVPPLDLPIICVDTDSHLLAKQSVANPPKTAVSENVAYVIYTSGSTGMPRGVVIEHRQLLNYLQGISEGLQLTDQANYATVSTFAADLGHTMVFPALCLGGCLHIISTERIADAAALGEYFSRHTIDYLKIVPSHFAALTAYTDVERLLPQRKLILGGEAPSSQLLDRLRKTNANCELVNHYGPTETTVGVLTCQAGKPGNLSERLPLGRPLANTRVYLLDAALNPVPIGTPGEVCLAGEGLARGYLNRPERTAEKFLPDPFSQQPGARLYRTGDLGRWLPDGNIEFLGRVDNQVKVRGYRIELGEIEAVLHRHPAVQAAAVLASADEAGDNRLLAYVAPQRKFAPTIKGRKRFLLPNGMHIAQQNKSETDLLYEKIFSRQAYLKHGITLRDNDCVFDVGANIGLFSLFVSEQHNTCRVYAFEPLEEISDLLNTNAELYGGQVKTFSFGLAENDKQAIFTYYPQYTMMSGLSDYADAASDLRAAQRFLRRTQEAKEESAAVLDSAGELVKDWFVPQIYQGRLRRLSEVMREEGIERINLLKIGAQRAELDILKGIDESDWEKIDQIVLEVDEGDPQSGEGRVARLLEQLQGKGFATVVEEDETLAGAGRYNLYAKRNGKSAQTNFEEQIPGWNEQSSSYLAPLSANELRAYLREYLPDYMVPTGFVLLEELPHTPNGKIDRQALPAYGQALLEFDLQYVAPRTPVEELLASIWAGILRVKQVGVNDNFFQLGGHSLLATQLASRITNSFHVDLPLAVLFESPTIAELAAYIETAMRDSVASEVPIIAPLASHENVPLSFAQQRLWFLEQLNPGLYAYNLASAIRLSGSLDREALEWAINEIHRRHESLRTHFVATEGNPVQVITPPMPVRLELNDLSSLPAEERFEEAMRLATQEAQQPFDLEKGPLTRIRLLKLEEEQHVALFTMHHIISDGWSKAILTRELAVFYEAFLLRQPSPLPELPIQYSDYSAWQRNWLKGEVLEKQINYWRNKLAGAPEITDLPTDRPRPAVLRFRGAYENIALSKSLSDALAALSRQEGSTLFIVLLAAFQALLHRYSGQQDIVIGSPLAGRNRLEIENLIGFFVNTILLRGDLHGDPTFRQLLARMRETALEAYAHQDLPFEKIVEDLHPTRDLSRQPLFQVVFALLNIPSHDLELRNLKISPFEASYADTQAERNQAKLERKAAKFDLTLSLKETSDGLAGSMEYNTDLFDATTVKRMLGHYQTILASIIANPDQRLSQLAMLTDAERHHLLMDFNQTATLYPQALSIHEIFEAQVEQTADQIAVSFENEQLTYAELNRRANQLAHYLQSLGLGVEDRVGLLVERSLEMIVGILGTLKAGGVYVPLDPAYPNEKLQFMIDDAGIQILLTQSYLGGIATPAEGQIFYLDSQTDELEGFSDENLPNQTRPNHLAYLMYTSGSTGQPKGVGIPHQAVVRLIKETNYATFGSDEVFLQLAPISFDAATFEIWGSLLNGSQLVVMPPHQPSLAEIGAALRDHSVTTLWLTAGLFHIMVDNRLDDLTGLRQLLAGGDVLSLSHVRKFLEGAKGARLINGYGPTESTTFACCYTMNDASQLDPWRTSVPIGSPISNTKVYILDASLHPTPIGVIGELYIGGDGLGRGYWNDPELTAEKFLPDPFSGEVGAHLYRTGDLVRHLPDGSIEFVGRADLQVKLRGFRIEVCEIEVALNQHTAVREAVVVAREDNPGDKRLVAYVVLEEEQAVTSSDMRSYLKQKLPDYMIPSYFVVLEKMPLTENGKVDRGSLPSPHHDTGELDANFVPPRDTVELLLAQIWEEVLDIPRVSVQANFFEVGGNSILAVILIARIERVFGMKLALAALFQGSTIEHLGILLRQEQLAASSSTAVAIQPRGEKRPFFCVHPAGGTVTCYVDLSRHLGLEQPFYAFQAKGLEEGEAPDHSVEAMASRYIEQMRAIQADGPYLIGGWSMGGVIAYEMARQLVEQGQTVGLLALFDTGLPPSAEVRNARLKLDDADMLYLIMSEMLSETIELSPETLRLLGPDEQLQFIMEQARKANKMVPDYQLQQARRHFEVFKNSVNAVSDYQAHPYTGRIVVFRSSQATGEAPPDLARGWDRLAQAGVEVHIVPGTHQQMLSEPHVAVLTQYLTTLIEQGQPDDDPQVVIRLMDS